MRLPLIDGDPASIDEAESIKMVRYAIDHGVNYLNLGYAYGLSQDERLTSLLSQALRDGYREKIKVTASLPSFFVHSSQDCERYLNRQLKSLGTDRVDFYLLGWLDRETWPRLKEMDVLGWAERALADGRIGRLGFSFHDHFQFLRDILKAYDNWDLCQFRYSYMDIDHHPGIGGLEYAAENGLAVVIAEPLRGGRLTKEPPQSVAEFWANDPSGRTLAEWGLRWVWNHPQVSTLVSDMSNLKQVRQNIALADSAEPDSLSVPEEILISQVRDAYRKLRPILCTACRACMPCPQGIDAPRIFEIYNDAVMYADTETARSLYRSEGHHAETCDQCGVCMKRCGNNIDIPDQLKAAHKLLARYR